MGNQIIRQPDGQLAIFSSNTDTIIVWDATEDEVLQWFVDRAAEDTRRQVRDILRHVIAGQPARAYYQFAMTWQEALESDREHDGEVWRHFAEEVSADDS